MSVSNPCLDEKLQGLNVDEAVAQCGDYLSGDDFVCERTVGRAACGRIIRFEKPDEYGVPIREVVGDCAVRRIDQDVVRVLHEVNKSETGRDIKGSWEHLA